MKHVSYCGLRAVVCLGLAALLFVLSTGTTSSTTTTAVPPTGTLSTTTTSLTWTGNVTGPGTAQPENCDVTQDPSDFCSDFQLEVATPGFVDAFINWTNPANDLGL